MTAAPPGQVCSSAFQPAWWLRSRHAQTLFPALCRRHVQLPLRRQRLELPDGDFLDLDWALPTSDQTPPADDAPLVLLLHGLQGSSRSSYIRGLLRALTAAGLRALVMHFRGCSGEMNRLPRSYHSGETTDLAYVVAELQTQHPGVPLMAVGYSLGGNVLLKWLGETGSDNPLHAAVAVSVPYHLARAADDLNRGFARLYQRHLVTSLCRGLRRKRQLVPMLPELRDEAIGRLRSFWEFDDAVTAPLHGFAGVHDYYTRSSSGPYLRHIRVPTLLLHARDDPFMSPGALPTAEQLGPTVTFECSDRGGHVGFVAGGNPLRPRYWLEERIPGYLCEQVRALRHDFTHLALGESPGAK